MLLSSSFNSYGFSCLKETNVFKSTIDLWIINFTLTYGMKLMLFDHYTKFIFSILVKLTTSWNSLSKRPSWPSSSSYQETIRIARRKLFFYLRCFSKMNELWHSVTYWYEIILTLLCLFNIICLQYLDLPYRSFVRQEWITISSILNAWFDS